MNMNGVLLTTSGLCAFFCHEERPEAGAFLMKKRHTCEKEIFMIGMRRTGRNSLESIEATTYHLRGHKYRFSIVRDHNYRDARTAMVQVQLRVSDASWATGVLIEKTALIKN